MLARRPRRNRKSASIRALIEEVTLSANDFIFPLFLIEGIDKKEEIGPSRRRVAGSWQATTTA